MGKKKVISEEVIHDMVLPTANDILCVATKLLGFDRIMVKYQEGYEHLCRIRGKMKRRIWIREGDVALVLPWDFQTDTRDDIIWRYTRGQVDWMRKNVYLNA